MPFGIFDVYYIRMMDGTRVVSGEEAVYRRVWVKVGEEWVVKEVDGGG